MRTILVSVLGGLLMAGCYDDGADWREGRSAGLPGPTDRAAAPWDAPHVADLVVVDAHLSGSLGAVDGFSEEPYRVTAYRSEGLDLIRVDATDAVTGQWVMSEVYVEGGVDHPSLREGETVFFDTHARDYAPDGEVFVTGLGCSGPAELDFEYDEFTQGVEAQVSPGSLPDQRIFEFNLTFSDGSTADLSVELVVPTDG